MAEREKLLVPTDFSEESLVGVRAAVAMAKRLGGAVTLVHVYDSSPLDPPVPFPDQGRVERDMSRHAERRLGEVRATLPGDVESSTVALNHPSPAVAITRHAQEMGADMIVVATHGRTGLPHLFMGSVAEKIVRHARCPVMTVPAR